MAKLPAIWNSNGTTTFMSNLGSLQLENGGYLLIETGDHLLLEDTLSVQKQPDVWIEA